MNINKTMFICLLLLSLIVSSFNGVSIRSNTTCVESITLTYFFPPPTISAQLSSDSIVHSVTIDDLPVTHETDQPCLPVKPLRVLLPNGLTVDDVTVEIDQTPLVISSINPIKGSHLLPINTISENTDTSKNSSDQSKDLFSIIGIFTLRGYSILYLTLHPVIYDENSQQLTYHPRLTVTIRTTQSSASKTIRGLQSDKDQVGSIVENPYIMQTYEPTISHLNRISSATYLVITNRQLLNSGLEDTFQFLIQSKIDKGISARIITVEDIFDDASFSVNGTWGDNNPSNPFYQMPITEHFERFDDTSARIRNYIRYAYMELGTEYVLLGGDADITNESQNIIPARGLFANESGLPLISHGITLAEEEDDIPSDVYYACLDGTFNYDMDEHFGESKDRNDITLIDEADLLSEISVGRACVDSELEVAYFVEKTLRYEQSADSPFLKKILFVGEYLGFPGISAYGGNYKDLVKPYVPSSYNIETLYDRDLPQAWNKNDLIEIINNATPHIINHDGHSYYGYNMRMHNADVDLLTNHDCFLLYSHGCMAGGFDNPSGYDCIAERLTVETPSGAFAAIMNARYGLGSENNLDSPSLALDISFFKALFNKSIRNIGPANHYSKEDHIWHIDENGIRWVYYETNLFGDPELSIHDASNEPVEITVDITRPEQSGCIYVKDIQLLRFPFLASSYIFGPCSVQVDAISNPEGYVYSVEFLVDDISYFIDTSYPFEWKMGVPLKGKHDLSVIAHGRYGETNTSTLPIYAWILEK
jgi:hypothetical protein